MKKLLENKKTCFILSLNKKIYKRRIIHKAVKEEDWISLAPAKGQYFKVMMKTGKKEEALGFVNFLLYRHRIGQGNARGSKCG